MKDIPGYENLYAITKYGRIWSYPKPCSSREGKWLKQQIMINNKGRSTPHRHYFIGLYKNKKCRNYQIHRLVALTYIPNPEDKLQINHKDGNSLNNHVNNLEWVTASENIRHGIRLGLIDNYSEKCKRIRSENGKKTGAINGMRSRRLFSFAEAECIRRIHKIENKSCLAIAKVYGCAGKTINNICNYESYLKEI